MINIYYSWLCQYRVAREKDQANFSEPLVLLGKGSGRLCYQHPTNPALCVKIPRNHRGLTESRVEYRYMKLVRFFHKEDTQCWITGFHGRVCTTAGIGWVSDKVLDVGGTQVPPLLDEALSQRAFDAEPERWLKAYEGFMHWRFNTAVVVRDASVSNICVKRLSNGDLQFILTDGVGPRGTFPRWIPLKRYAQRRNRAYASKSEFKSIENLIEFCEKRTADPDFHRDPLVEEPELPVRCLLPKRSPQKS